MKQERPKTQIVLIEIQYNDSMNAFEDWYGENISYQEIEQKSYIEFKELMFTKICSNIKFRKHCRIGQALTIKADMLKEEIEKFKELILSESVSLTHNWVVSDVTIIKDSKNFLLKSKDSNSDDEELNSFE